MRLVAHNGRSRRVTTNVAPPHLCDARKMLAADLMDAESVRFRDQSQGRRTVWDPKLGEDRMVPSSRNDTSLASNAASRLATSRRPFSGSRRSPLSLTRHGLMCDARNSAATFVPVTAQRPFQIDIKRALNRPCPMRAEMYATHPAGRTVRDRMHPLVPKLLAHERRLNEMSGDRRVPAEKGQHSVRMAHGHGQAVQSPPAAPPNAAGQPFATPPPARTPLPPAARFDWPWAGRELNAPTDCCCSATSACH
jgi:hypothetical protein